VTDRAALQRARVKGKLIVPGVELGTVNDAPALGSYDHRIWHLASRSHPPTLVYKG